jgi:hypothetical protein
VYIEAGAALEIYRDRIAPCNFTWYAVTPVAGPRWSVYLNDQWTVFAAVRLGYRIGFSGTVSCGVATASDISYSQFAWDSALGAFWQVNDRWSARFELGYFGAKAGAGMDLQP